VIRRYIRQGCRKSTADKDNQVSLIWKKLQCFLIIQIIFLSKKNLLHRVSNFLLFLCVLKTEAMGIVSIFSSGVMFPWKGIYWIIRLSFTHITFIFFDLLLAYCNTDNYLLVLFFYNTMWHSMMFYIINNITHIIQFCQIRLE